MKILLSSKALAKFLSEIDFDTDQVRNVQLLTRPAHKEGDRTYDFMINTVYKRRCICVEVVEFEGYINQRGRDWVHLKNLVCLVEEQPIVLEIKENIMNVIFQY